MKDTIDANLNDNAIENIMAPKNPDMVLFIFSYLYVFGNGLFTTVIVTGFGLKKLI